ncbi:MAG: hydroxyacid dehydrogenase [Armatimonadetes bacterium]|nr:hydroxyacid dehydrogenase [Armatimonadota bacterium]
MVTTALLAPLRLVDRVYGPDRLKRIEAMTGRSPLHIEPAEVRARLDELAGVEMILSTWGMPRLEAADLDRLPRLRAVLYAAGSAQPFAGPLLERGVAVSSAWRANAVPVARTVLAQTLLALKGYFRNVREYRADPAIWQQAFMGPGSCGETVALLGAGAVGCAVLDLLRPMGLRLFVFDPFLTTEKAASLGVEKVTVAEAFAQGFVVSNHLADKDEVAGLIDARLLRSMRPGACFINTGRGRTVNETDLAAVMAERTDLTALLDVTHPEPMPPGSPLWRLPNVQVSTHLAGAIQGEVGLLGERMLDELGRLLRGEPLQDAVTLAMLPVLA